MRNIGSCYVLPPQSYKVSTINSSVIPIKHLEAFIGDIEDTIDFNMIHVTVQSDKKCMIEVQQSDDANIWTTVLYTAAQEHKGAIEELPTVLRYNRVLVHNLSDGDMSCFRLQTYYTKTKRSQT